MRSDKIDVKGFGSKQDRKFTSINGLRTKEDDYVYRSPCNTVHDVNTHQTDKKVYIKNT
jgi:hypothetical protein